MLLLQRDFQSRGLGGEEEEEKSVPCIADALPHPPSSANKKLFKSNKQTLTSKKSQSKNDPCSVYVASHKDDFFPLFYSFFKGAEMFWSRFLDPQRWRMFFFILIITVEFLPNEKGFAYWEKANMKRSSEENFFACICTVALIIFIPYSSA